MRIKKLLAVPCDTLVSSKKEVRWRTPFLDRAISYLAMKLGKGGFTYDGEVQFYGDFPVILGRENVFVYGRFHTHLYSKSVPESSPYPSCHGLAEGTTVSDKELDDVLRNVDAVFISIRAGERGEKVLTAAGRRGIPRALFDFEDHPQIYHVGAGSRGVYSLADARRELTRGYRPVEHFELYFKKDLPLGWRSDEILPLAPTPVRPASYRFPGAAKRHAVFYSGRLRPGCQADREEVLNLLRRFPGSCFLDQDLRRQNFLTTSEYWRYLAESRMALSPSGKSWDSFRHGEVGLAPATLLVAPHPFIETAGPPLRDGVNAVLYNTAWRKGRYHLADGPELVEKVRYYLDRPDECEVIAKTWSRDVLAGHTVLARSCYILESMENAFGRS